MRRLAFLLLGYILLGINASQAQRKVTVYSLRAYVPVSFDASYYRFGAPTWRRWNMQGTQLGLNIKKDRFEQEFVLGSPWRDRTTHFYEFPGSNGTSYYSEDFIQHTFSMAWQAGYEMFTTKLRRFHFIPGLGVALSTNFSKRVTYSMDPEGFLDNKMQVLLLRPYIHGTVHYSLNSKWGMDATLMYSPYSAVYWRNKSFNRNGDTKTMDSAWISDALIFTFFSRLGISYRL